MAEEEEEGTGEEEAPKKKSKLLLIIIVVVVLLVGGGGGAAFFLMGGEPEGDGEEEQVDIAYKTIGLRPFIINLADNTSYLKVTLLLEYDPTLVEVKGGAFGGGGAVIGGAGGRREPISGELPGALQDREAMIRDAVITLVGGKTRQELLTAEGKEALKEELLEVMNDASGLDEAAIVGVYFLEFIIQ